MQASAGLAALMADQYLADGGCVYDWDKSICLKRTKVHQKVNIRNPEVLNDFSLSRPSLDYVDMLRGCAIIGVLLAHSAYGMNAAGLQQLPFHIEWIFAAGKHGVTLFFVVSAFALMRSIFLRYGRESQPVEKYFFRRFFRIAPAYYTVLLLVFFLSGKGVSGYTNPAEEHLTLFNLIAHLTFLNGFFPFYSNDFLGVEWSVSTEFTFYLLLPTAFLWINKPVSAGWQVFRALSAYCGTLLFSWLMYFKGGYLQALGGGFASPVFASWSYFFLATHLHAFMAGATVWLLIQTEINPYFRVHRQKLARLALPILVIIGIAATAFEGARAKSP